MTNVRSVPSSRATSAIRAAAAGSPTPRSWRRRAGRVRQRAEQVERGPDADLAAGRPGVLHRRVEVRREQEREAERRAARRRPTPRRGRSGRRARRARRPSPTCDVIARLPCFATGTPAAATTSAAVVEMLNVPLAVAAGADDVDRALGRVDAERPARASRSRSRPARRRSRRASAGPSAARPAGPASPRRPSPRPSRARASSIESVPPSTIVARAARTTSLIAAASLVATGSAAADAVARPARPSRTSRSPSSSRDGLALRPAWRRKFARRCGPCGVSTDLRVELDALERQRDVADAHDDPVDLAHRGHPQLRRQRRRVDRERVVAGRHERRRHALEQARRRRGSPRTPRRGRASARGRSTRRTPPPSTASRGRRRAAGARGRRRPRPSPTEMPASSGSPGPGRDDDPAQVRGRVVGERLDAVAGRSRRCGRRGRRRPAACERLDEVEREAVVVVDDEDHGRTRLLVGFEAAARPRRRLASTPAASSIARRSAAALCSVSSNSRSGTRAGDDPGARVDVGLAVLEDRAPDGDRRVEVAVVAEVADRAAVQPAALALRGGDQLHRPDLRARR